MYKRYWKVNAAYNGYKMVLIFYATENDLIPYLETELPNYTSYTGANDAEVMCAKAIGLHVYMV